MAFHVEGLPDDLPPGQYDVRMKYAFWFANRQGESELMMWTEYVGPKKPGKLKHLLSITVEAK
jgi:hypothetical protein